MEYIHLVGTQGQFYLIKLFLIYSANYVYIQAFIMFNCMVKLFPFILAELQNTVITEPENPNTISSSALMHLLHVCIRP